MRTRVIARALLLIAMVGATTLAARGNSYVGVDKQWTIVNFADPVLVKGRFVMGPVLIVHDSAKMAKGEPCTTFFRFDPAVDTTATSPTSRLSTASISFAYVFSGT